MSEDLQNILRADIELATSRPQPDSVTVMSQVEQICYYTSFAPDAGKASFLQEASSSHSELLRLRVHLQNGAFKKAKKILEQATDLNSLEKTEFLYEKTRLLCFEGAWMDAICVAEEALRLGPISITRLSLLQCRALAFYELGSFELAYKDCNMILSQKDLYPQAIAVRYAKVLLIKLDIDSLSDVSENIIDDLWQDFFRQKEVNLDELLLLARLQIDVQRELKRPLRAWAWLSYLVAKKMGDSLYEALALLDILSTKPKNGDQLKARLIPYFKSFIRIENLYAEYSERNSSTTSSVRLLKTNPENPQEKLNISNSIRYVLVSDYALLIDLEGLQINHLSGKTNWSAFSHLFAKGSVERSKLFQSLWQQKYAYDKHDGVLRTFLHRLKKTTGLCIESKNGFVEISGTLFL